MTKTLTITAIKVLPPLISSLTVSFYYFPYLSSSKTLAAANVTINTDGTLASPVAITGLSENVRYTVEAVNDFCETIYVEDFIFNCANTCPPGFTKSDDGTFCFQIQVIPATPPTDQQNAVASQEAVYGVCGSYIFDPGYNQNGTGTATHINPANTFWINGSGGCESTGTTGAGPVNRLGIWGPTQLPNQTVGFSVCFSLTSAGTYYVGVAGDDYPTIQIDGTVIVQTDPIALDEQLGIPVPPGIGGSTFRAFCIYPVTLSAGEHVLAVIGVNGGSAMPNPAMIAAEIYNNTAAEIEAATSTGDLNIIFSTANMIGQPIDIGTFGYTCPAGYTLSKCTSPVVCQRTIIVDPIC